ncbi:MAG: FMN-binding protein [Oscillospiraceae bacterium]
MNEEAEREKVRRWEKSGVILGIAIALCALQIFLIGLLVSQVVEKRDDQKLQVQMEAAVPGATVFSEVYFKDPAVETILGAYDGTTLKGHCVVVKTRGFAGPMELLVGVGVTGEVTGVVVREMRRAEGLGGKLLDHDFLTQYVGKSGTVNVGAGRNAVTAVSGATYTSRAITKGVNTALAAMVDWETKGGEPSGEETV